MQKDTRARDPLEYNITQLPTRNSASGFLLEQAYLLEKQAADLKQLAETIKYIDGTAESTLYNIFYRLSQNK